jgi:hypothetical protein
VAVVGLGTDTRSSTRTYSDASISCWSGRNFLGLHNVYLRWWKFCSER